MVSNKINEVSFPMSSVTNEHKIKDRNKDTDKKPIGETNKDIDNSVISKDAVIECEFLKRIKASDEDVCKGQFKEKYSEEYKNIKDEIASGKYGNDAKKYMKLLDKAFKDSLEDAINSEKKALNETLEKTINKHYKIKFSGAQLIQYHKQYETATGIVWILRAENKRISQEIEQYRKKKDHVKVASLTQLRDSYTGIIKNVSGIATKIRSDIDDNYSEDQNKK